jgi:hypothetical protein
MLTTACVVCGLYHVIMMMREGILYSKDMTWNSGGGREGNRVVGFPCSRSVASPVRSNPSSTPAQSERPLSLMTGEMLK